MIDLHSHVLPGLDDGSPNLEESVRMLRVASAAGTTDLVATPHANLQHRFDPEVVEGKLADLRRVCDLPIRLHYGCDFHLYWDNIQDALANPSKYTINHRKYLLVEFSDLLIPKTSDEVFARMLDAGMIPIVTHPERNPLLYHRLDQIERWASQGVLMQVTAQSLLGRFGPEARRFSRELVQRGLIHVVASDAHDSDDRPPRLDHAYKHVARRWNEALARRLFIENPRAVLEGAPAPARPAAEAGVPRKWYQFW